MNWTYSYLKGSGGANKWSRNHSKDMGVCWEILAFMEWKIKSTLRYHLTLVWIVIFKKTSSNEGWLRGGKLAAKLSSFTVAEDEN